MAAEFPASAPEHPREPTDDARRHTAMTTSPRTDDRSPRPRRTFGRPLLLAGTALALGGIFTAGVLVGRDGGASTQPGRVTPLPGHDSPFRLANADLDTTGSCEELLSSYQERALEVVGPWGWESGTWKTPMPVAETAVVPLAAARASGDAAAPAPTAATSSATGTNVQEAGVDEPDVVKTDGTLLVRVAGSSLVVHDVTAQAPRELSRTSLPDLDDPEILLVGDTVVALGATRAPRRDPLPPHPPATRVVTLDLSDPAAPTTVSDTVVRAALVTARQHDDVVRVVVRNDLPQLDFRHPRRGPLAQRRALRHNQRMVRETTLADWLPTLPSDGSTESDEDQAVACDDVAVPTEASAPLGTVTTVAFRADAPRERTSVAVATASDLAYFSPDRLTLASAPPLWGWGPWPAARSAVQPQGGRTHLVSFALDGTGTTFVASGHVDGQLRDRWSLDSADGVLRVAVGATAATGNFNSVVTLAEDDGRLVEHGRLDHLGVNEEIKAVRWFDDLALVVTFRQTDPLYAVDLTDPAEPALLGELKIPGFSQYLHPVGRHRLIGVGQHARRTGVTVAAQAALFNVTDLTRPRRLDTVTYARGSEAGAASDPRQFTWLPERRTALTVVTDGWVGRTAWVSALRLAGGRFHETRTEVAHGHDVTTVRLVPLPSGKVVLLAGDDVTFFDVT